MEADKTMSVLLHVDPADDPTVLDLTTLYIRFDDSAKQFTLEHCECVVRVNLRANQNQTFITELPVEIVSKNYGEVRVRFPQRGIYQISVIGNPREQKIATPPTPSFTPFYVSYDIRVARESGEAPTLSLRLLYVYQLTIHHVLHVGIFIIGMIVALILIYTDKPKKEV